MINWIKDAQFKKIILSLLFSVSLTNWTMSTFFKIPDIYNIVAALVLHGLIFLCLSYMMRKRLSGGILFLLGSILYLFITVYILMQDGSLNHINYLLWIVSSQPDSDKFIPGFWAVTLLLSAYGFSTVVYYFTVIRFRVFVLLLIGAVPLLLQSAKTDKEITLSSIIFLLLFFLLNIERARQKSGKETRLTFVNDRWYIVSMVFFAAITLAICYIAPKPYRVPKILYLDNLINRTVQPLGLAIQNAVQNQNTDLTLFNPGMYKSESMITSVTAPLGKRVLYEVKSDEPLYLRVQSWDSYSRNCWINGNKSLADAMPVKDYAKRQMNPGVIVSLLDSIRGRPDAPSEILKLCEALNKPSLPAKNKSASIRIKGAPMLFFMHPPGMMDIKTQNKEQNIYINENLLCKGNIELSPNESYDVEYVTKDLSPASREFQVVKSLDAETAFLIMNPDNYKKGTDKGNQGFIGSGDRSALEEARIEMDTAYRCFTNLPDDMPGRIYNLANEITAGRTSDYDKASAIEQFFHTSGFKYSYQPARLPGGMDYNDFFLFNSRKGVCVHFASAMVILARACGLPARYVEGFVADEKDPVTGLYLVREKDAHAFPEVYIAGYGWMVFEPTVSMEESDNWFDKFFSEFGNNVRSIAAYVSSFINGLPVWVKTLSIPVMAFIILIMIYYFIRIREKMWRKRTLKAGRGKSLEQIFKRITVLLKRIDFDMKKHETPSSYSVRISKELGLELSRLSDVFNRSKYGGMEPSEEDVKNAAEIYDSTLALVRKHLGWRKSWMV